MNPLDVSATLDQSTMNVSLNMTNLGKKPSVASGIPLPVMLQPSASTTVSPCFPLFHSIKPFRLLMTVIPIITKPPRPIVTSYVRAAIALGVNMMRRVNRGVPSRSRRPPGPNTPTESIVLPRKMLWSMRFDYLNKVNII